MIGNSPPVQHRRLIISILAVAIPAALVGGAATIWFALPARPAYVISGNVVDEDGNPLRNVYVSVSAGIVIDVWTETKYSSSSTWANPEFHVVVQKADHVSLTFHLKGLQSPPGLFFRKHGTYKDVRVVLRRDPVTTQPIVGKSTTQPLRAVVFYPPYQGRPPKLLVAVLRPQPAAARWRFPAEHLPAIWEVVAGYLPNHQDLSVTIFFQNDPALNTGWEIHLLPYQLQKLQAMSMDERLAWFFAAQTRSGQWPQ